MDRYITGIDRRTLREICRWSLLVLVCGVASLLVRAEDAVTLSLNLPDGLTYTETSHSKDSMQVTSGDNERERNDRTDIEDQNGDP